MSTETANPMNLFVEVGFICRRMHDKDNGPGIPLFELKRVAGEPSEFDAAQRQINDALVAAWNTRSAPTPAPAATDDCPINGGRQTAMEVVNALDVTETAKRIATGYWNSWREGLPPIAGALIDKNWHGCGDDVRRAFLSAARAVSPAPAQPDAFQQRVRPWMLACFGEQIAADTMERNHRFLEEALELVQACGCTASEAHQLVDYVYGRPVGERAQEVGGVMVTLAALCLAQGLDMHAAGETELARIWTKVDVIRAKQAAKPKNSPLPEGPGTALPQQDAGQQEVAITSTTTPDTPESVAARLRHYDQLDMPLYHEAAALIDTLQAALAASEERERAMREALTNARPVVDAVADEASWCELRPNGPMTAFAWYIDGSFIDPDAAVAALSSIDAALSTGATNPQANSTGEDAS